MGLSKKTRTHAHRKRPQSEEEEGEVRGTKGKCLWQLPSCKLAPLPAWSPRAGGPSWERPGTAEAGRRGSQDSPKGAERLHTQLQPSGTCQGEASWHNPPPPRPLPTWPSSVLPRPPPLDRCKPPPTTTLLPPLTGRMLWKMQNRHRVKVSISGDGLRPQETGSDEWQITQETASAADRGDPRCPPVGTAFSPALPQVHGRPRRVLPLCGALCPHLGSEPESPLKTAAGSELRPFPRAPLVGPQTPVHADQPAGGRMCAGRWHWPCAHAGALALGGSHPSTVPGGRGRPGTEW